MKLAIKNQTVLIYTEHESKNNQGEIENIRKTPKQVVIFPGHSDSRNPDKVFRSYISHRSSNESKCLYLRLLVNMWYSHQVIGIHAIEKIIKSTLTSTSDTESNNQKFIAHSLRATATTRMYQSELENKLLVKLQNIHQLQ